MRKLARLVVIQRGTLGHILHHKNQQITIICTGFIADTFRVDAIAVYLNLKHISPAITSGFRRTLSS